jgi:D-tyrosyl-tRNA(Tyr) deacylase
MMAVLQRVSRASVSVDGTVIAAIDGGLLVLLGVAHGDTAEDIAWLVRKTAELRIFEDGLGKMNRSVTDAGGSALVVSQFTLLADCRKGRRPAFTGAAAPDVAERLYLRFADELSGTGIPTATGRFGAMMDVSLVNDGPVTIVLDSRTRSGLAAGDGEDRCPGR